MSSGSDLDFYISYIFENRGRSQKSTSSIDFEESASAKMFIWTVRSFHVFGKIKMLIGNFQAKLFFYGGTPNSNLLLNEFILCMQTGHIAFYFCNIYILISATYSLSGMGSLSASLPA